LNRFIYVLLVLLFFISACEHSGSRRAEQSSDWLSDAHYFEHRQSAYNSLVKWQYSAKVGVKGKDINQQVNLVWSYSDRVNNVRLYGPLGIGQIKIEFDEHSVQLSDSKGVLHQGLSSEGQNAEQLLTQITNLPIPIDALSYWLFALPTPEHAFRYQLNEQGDVSVIDQLGWQIDYSGYRDYNGRLLPRKLTAKRERDNFRQDTITVKLITKAWQWTPAIDFVVP